MDSSAGIGGNDTPYTVYEVFPPWELAAIPLAGVAVAVAAAVIPGAGPRTNVIETLQAE